MPLEPIQFAHLVSRLQLIASRGDGFGRDDIQLIYDTLEQFAKAQGTYRFYDSSNLVGNLKDLVRAARADRKIEAIKAVRSMTGQGLKESKDLVEAAWGPTWPPTTM